MLKQLIISSFIVILNLIFFQHLLIGQTNKYKLSTIVIDAGHGGRDPGASGKKYKEKDIVLSIALKTGEYITKNMPGVKVIYTRTTDVLIPLHKRSKIANDNNADLFICIHANSNPNPKAIGAETYVMGLHKSKANLEVAKLENSSILHEENYDEQYEGYDPNSPESFIIFSLLQNAFLEQSIEMATILQNEFEHRVKRKNRGVKQAGFLVLWRTTMPSIYPEVGFLSNSTEEKFLGSEKGQDYIASAIYRAVRKYKDKIENQNNTTENQDSNKKPLLEKDTLTTNTPPEDKVATNIIDKPSETKNQIFFKVQIASSKKQIPLNSSFFKEFKNIEELIINDVYKYTIGEETSYLKINQYRAEIANYFPGAFVVAFKNGKRIPLKEALKEINN